MKTLAIFLISLQSLYFNAIGLPLYSIFGCALLFLIAISPRRSIETGGYTFPAHMAWSVSGPFILLCLSLITAALQGEAEAKRIAGLIVATTVPISYAIVSRSIDIKDVIYKLICIHSAVFFIQFFLYFGFSIEFDPVNLLSDIEQRGKGGSLNHELLGSFRRLGGLFSEPGTYGTFVAPLVAILAGSNPTEKRYRLSIYIGLASLFLTFSIYAWVFSAMICAMMFFSSLLNFFLFALFSIPAARLAWPYIEYRFLQSTNSNIDSGTGFRAQILINIYDYVNSGVINFLFGTGLLAEDVPFSFEGAINDVGLLPFTLLASGVFGVVLIFSIITLAARGFGRYGLAFAFIILGSKISVLAPMFWLTIAVATDLGYRNRLKNLRER